ncbi:E3 ubiquitin-protein ligase RNF10 [Onthophagus taurus]|uniref:E3 ubiquitin-protein ligase RNF10 n=1 Tax=Onthophagus taurus TaxID=166361 RepID=UPI0039BDB976
MDKKGARSIQSQSTKGLTSDSKKSQDGVPSKPWPKGGRRREPSAGTYPSKSNDGSRVKPVPQRNRNFSNDKRPRSRGFCNPCSSGGNTMSRIAMADSDAEVELGSVFDRGCKKLNAIDLWNFNYRSRNNVPINNNYGRSKSVSFKHKYSKEQFLQANCQFIVKSSADYRQHMSNADILVDWDLIEQINVSGSFECPICLYPPVATKITRCGHVYCWSCMLHYLSLTDKSSRQCPICFEYVQKKDLKSASIIPQIHYKVNDTITFKLMKRQRGSLIVYKAADTIDETKTIFNMSDEKVNEVYCKLLLANEQDVMSIIDREITQLEVALADDETSPERCFIEEALQMSKDRERELFNKVGLECLKEEIKDKVDMSGEECMEQIVENELVHLRQRFESSNNNEVGEIASGVNEELIATKNNNNKVANKIFYFYQASDGQHIYIHPVNARMLEHTYGSLEFAPHEITGRILEKEEIVMMDDIRNRTRYLQHLPLTCHFVRAEIQLKYPVVSKETLKYFQAELDNRKRDRKYKAREEKRSEELWVQEENRIMGKIPEANICLTSSEEFPNFSDAMAIIAAEMAMSPSTRTSISETYSSTPPESSLSMVGSLEKEYAGPSFAKMLSTAKKQTNPTVPIEINKDKNKESVRLINVTGSKQSSKFKLKAGRRDSDSEPEVEGYTPAPRSSAMLADALSAALEKVSVGNNDDGKNLQSGKKKKKNKQKLLYTTSRGGFF